MRQLSQAMANSKHKINWAAVGNAAANYNNFGMGAENYWCGAKPQK